MAAKEGYIIDKSNYIGAIGGPSEPIIRIKENLLNIFAERGIEYGLLSVTLKILNPLHRLYIKKSCEFLQSYEKSATSRWILYHAQ